MNKVVVTGVIIAVVIIVGAIVLGQDNKSEVTDTTEVTDTIEVTNIENDQTEPKEFSVDLQESVGMTEKP